MAGAGVIDGHMQGEIVRIDAQLAELIGTDQQVQRQLFVTEVVTDHLRQTSFTAGTECQLQCTLQVALIGDGAGILQTVFSEQFAIDHHMVLRRIAVAEFFQIGTQQAVKTRVAPLRQQAVQPRAIHQFGRCHGLQKVQRMSLVAEVLARSARLTLLQVIGVLPGNFGAVPGDPVLPHRRILRQFFRQQRGALQLLGEKSCARVSGECSSSSAS